MWQLQPKAKPSQTCYRNDASPPPTKGFVADMIAIISQHLIVFPSAMRCRISSDSSSPSWYFPKPPVWDSDPHLRGWLGTSTAPHVCNSPQSSRCDDIRVFPSEEMAAEPTTCMLRGNVIVSGNGYTEA